MVRNSKRRAFTIVELVIVIAVIAILAAVMIPTFGGVIESANVSADKQILSTVNSQIAIYTGLGNKIETEADLWKALKGDFNGGSDMTEKFDPRSAKHGYHYWYNGATQTVELLCVEDLENNYGMTVAKGLGRMVVYADDVQTRENAPIFAESSPRAFINGKIENGKNLYFLDYVTDEEGKEGNDFSKFFFTLENLSKDDLDKYEGKYAAALKIITDIAASNRDANKQFAATLAERMAATVILTNKPAIVGGANEITHVYIPENKNLDENKNPTQDYYLNHTNTSDIKNKTDVDSVVVIPENVKLGDGCLDAFDDVTIRVNIAIENIAGVISAGAVSENATVQIGGNNYTIDGSVVTNKDTGEKLETKLLYKNPVTEDFVLSASGDYIDGDYIALHKINEGNFKVVIKNTEALTGKNGEATYVPYCQDLTWEIVEGENVDISKDGTLTFKEGFNGSTITLKATPVAVNDVATAPTDEITLTVVKLNKVNFAFNGATMDLTVDPRDAFFVEYGDSANFSNFTYTYVTNDVAATTISGLNTENLGAPSLEVITAADNAHFGITNNNGTYNLGFEMDQVRTTILNGDGYVSENVTINVGDNGSLFTNTYEVRIEPCLFTSALPSYKGYVYTIGDDNPVTLGMLFKLTGLFEGATVTADVTVKTYQAESVTPEGVPVKPVDTTSNNTINKEGKTSWTDYEITFTDLTTNVIAISTNTEMKYISIKVVDGFNIFAGEEAKFVNSTSTDSATSITVTNGNQSVVLHSDLNFTGKYTEDCVRTLQGAKIWGNYYKLTAKDFKDTDTNTKNGYGFIHVSSGNNEINQLIIDGPVYAEPATSASDLLSLGITNKYKNFCNGINVGSNLTINDSYIFGFNSTVRVNGGQFVANGTVFDGGAWSNIFLANATKFQLNDCKTIQDAYQATVDDTTQYSIGLGIYVHDTMNNQSTKLTLELNDTKQYNWISTDDKNYGGTFFDLAVDEIFKTGGIAETQQFIHQEKYVNAGVASIGARLEVWMLVTTKKATVTEYTDNYSLGGTDGSKYTAQKVDEETKVNLLVANVFVKANIYSYQCGDSCDCGAESAGIGYTYSIQKFLNEKK